MPDTAVHMFELTRRLLICLSAVRLSMICWACLGILLSSRRPIPEASLAEALGTPRTTVRTYTVKLENLGYLAKSAEGLVLTPLGRAHVSDFVEQTVEIVIGRKSAYDKSVHQSFQERNALFYKRNRANPPIPFHFAPRLSLDAERVILRKIPQIP